jgi:hypothetical protein
MKSISKFGLWLVEYTAEDGARLNRLCYDNYDLMTKAPGTFRVPKTDFGEYEKRPVFGYDDCFPSCGTCKFPGTNWQIPDHGELCWLGWDIAVGQNNLTFTVKSKGMPLIFTREMIFLDSSIKWKFKVFNNGSTDLPFQHIIHPLLKLSEIKGFELPGFGSVFNKSTERKLDLQDSRAVKNYLASQPKGTANMLYIRNIDNNKITVNYRNGINLRIVFPLELYTTIGIWWNNLGYPDEEGIRRDECAFEPVTGSTSVLSETYEEGKHLLVSSGKEQSWEIEWEIFR